MNKITIYLYALILIALFGLGCVLSFNNGFRQGINKAKECIENKGFIELTFNSFKCNTEHNLVFINYNFSEVKTP